MKSRVLHLCAGLGVWLACGGNARTTLLGPPVLAAGAGGVTGSSGAGGAGGTVPVPADAGVDASDASGSGSGAGGRGGAGGLDEPDASTDPGGPIVITIDPESIVFFALPINSVRFAAAGFDAATGVCASIIWDYSNNDLEVEPHCDDFGTYPSFPYVLVREPPESCDNLEGMWDYGDIEPLEPEVASGCFDPLAETVNVQLEVFSVPAFYRIIMNNEP